MKVVPDAAPDAPLDDGAIDVGDGPRCAYDPTGEIPNPGTGPNHYWPLNVTDSPGVTVDVVGNAHGTTIDSAEGEPGQIDEALGLDGEGAYVRFADIVDVGTSSFTIHLWYFSTAESSPWRMLVNKGSSGSSTPPLRGYFLRLRDGSIEFAVNGSGEFTRAIAPEPSLNQWHHVVAVLNRPACTIRLYVDGSLAAEQDYSELGVIGTLESNTRLAFGAADRYPGSLTVNQYFKGLLDDIGVFYRPLSPQEITELHALGLGKRPLLQ